MTSINLTPNVAIEFQSPTFAQKAKNKIGDLSSKAFNKACPRGTPQRFIASNIIRPAIFAYTAYKICQVTGHILFLAEKNAHHDHEQNPAGMNTLEAAVGFAVIFLGGVSLLGIGLGVKHCADSYAEWKEKEQVQIDLEAQKEQVRLSHRQD